MSTLLRIVGQGQGTDPPKRRKGIPSPSLSLTHDEARAVRAAARNIARTYGSLRKLAAALGVCPDILTKRRRPSAGLAVALARVSHVSVETVLGWTPLAAVPSPGKPPSPGKLPAHEGPAGSEGWAE